MMRNGIIAGGRLIVDNIKIIDYYPNKNMMGRIVKDVINSVGGGPHNVMVTLSKLQVPLPLSILGIVGDDQSGDFIIKAFESNNVDTKYIQKIQGVHTSFTDVFTEQSTGQRTFFHYAGANAELSYEHFGRAIEESQAKIFLVGNLLLLDKLDSEDPEFGMVSARVFKDLQDKGFKTTTDLVSVKSDKFPLIAKYCLKYLNYLIINEIEAQCLSGLVIRKDDHTYDIENLVKTAEFLIDCGVNDLVVIHMPEGGYALDKFKKSYWQDSFKVDKTLIKSSVGCGDAFNAGMIFSLHQELPVQEGLKVANASAMFCLFDYTTTGSATTWEHILKHIKTMSN